MLITDLKRKGNSETYYVYIDGNFYCSMQLEVLYKYHIKVGTEIDEDKFNEAKIESDKLVCSTEALNYVSKRLRTEFQVVEHLKKKGYCNEGIELAISRLKNYGYLNDEYFAKLQAKELAKTKGKFYIKKDLLTKGVSEDIIQNVLEELDGDDTSCREVATKWLKNKPLPLEIKTKEKLYRFLMSRGYTFDIIKRAVADVTSFEDFD